MLATNLWPQIVLWLLVIEHPHELEWRLMMQTVDRVAVNESPGDMVSVRLQTIDRIDRRDSWQASWFAWTACPASVVRR